MGIESKYLCDKCGKEIDHLDYIYTIEYKIHVFCKDCHKGFIQLIWEWLKK